MEVNDRGAWAEIVSRVFAGDRVNGVWTQLAATRGLGDGIANFLLHHDLIRADRSLNLEGRHPGVLADWAFGVARHVDVGSYDRKRGPGTSCRILSGDGFGHSFANIGRKVG